MPRPIDYPVNGWMGSAYTAFLTTERLAGMASTPDRNGSIPQATSGYWAESQRPLAALAFIAPLLMAYELGVIVLGPEAVRSDS